MDPFDAWKDRTVDPSDPFQLATRRAMVRPVEQTNTRSIIDRVLAPFEAPQQFLFSATKEIAEDGFQLKDLGTAAVHGARYFNPWSNEERIDPNEIRQIFFGDEADGLLKTSKNLAISLLYDPLLVTPLLRAAGVIEEGTKLFRTVDNIVNPAEAIIKTAAGFAQREVTPKLGALAKRVLGDDKAETWGTAIAQWLVSPLAGTPTEFKEKLEAFQRGMQGWRHEGYQVLKQAERLGGKEAQRLMAEALESEAVWLARNAEDMSAIPDFRRKIERLGIDEDIFWSVYDRARKLDLTIGEQLVRTGLIDMPQFEQMRGTHLRRVFMAFEHPQDYIKRLEDLNLPNVDRVSKKQLMASLNEVRSSLDEIAFKTPEVGGAKQIGLFGPGEQFGDAASYFRDGDRTSFNVRAFVDDLDEWLRGHPGASIDEVLSHVKNTMMKGADLPDTFFQKIAQHITGATFNPSKMRDDFIDNLRQRVYNPSFNWHAYREKVEVVAKREQIPQELLDVLGEVKEFGPRIASEVSEAGRLLEMRKLFDSLAGVTRNETGEIVSKTGSRVAALEREAIKGPAVQLRGKHLGELDGMWVSPAVAMSLNHLEGAGVVSNPSRKLWAAIGDAIRQGNGLWKTFKAVDDPSAQVRNFLGNAVLMELHGTSPLRVNTMLKGIRELAHYGKTGEMGTYMQLMQDAGVTFLQHTFSRAELQEVAKRLSDDTLKKGGIVGALERAFEGVLDLGRAYHEKAANAFEFSEKMFKMNVFIDNFEKIVGKAARRGVKITPEFKLEAARQAAAKAEQALFNYADVPHLVNFVRQYGIVPFATFPYKALPAVGKVLIEEPHRVLKYERTVDEINRAGAGDAETAAREIEALPDYMRESLVVRMPWEDGEGRPQYVDLSFFMPWYIIQDLAKQNTPKSGDLLPRSGTITPPALSLIQQIQRNEDDFGRPIVRPSMSTAEKFLAVGHHLGKFILPPSFPGGSRADSIGRALQAAARSEPGKVNWLLEHIGRGARGMGANDENIFAARGVLPQSQAQVSNLPLFPDTPAGKTAEALTGAAMGVLAFNTTASDPAQAVLGARADLTTAKKALAAEIARIRTNPSLSPRQKAEKIARLYDKRTKLYEDYAERVGSL